MNLAHQYFDYQTMINSLPILWKGLKMTLLICAAVIPLGLLGGLVVALGRQTRLTAVRITVIAFIDLFRALPPLFLLILLYAGLPFMGVRLSPFSCVCVAFLLNTSAYYGEVYRAGLESVGRGQREAARSTGLSYMQTMLFVVLPQAIRNVLPDLVSNTVEVVKMTSLASVVALPELLYSADMARAATLNSSPIVLAAAIYLAILWPIIRLASRLEHRLGH
ncbi:amino acid ABC transporter permease [Bradyrhizobium sp. AUGA SZCCT0182]|uniref:amino acid ABC transporter permease n=1 Tax=Bradyrhizobium sp. AUGA SZCCT0182 TaxID=2807667 RepID=UPI001BA581BA|nr:amino acid ABC transporter permease [Bradyrhizobium sp. AUGA SZCCT0182]MBR1231717.1 amino acid ABC transporter permease [Bradyrhizobium sp. AUGA SZCCT0182]